MSQTRETSARRRKLLDEIRSLADIAVFGALSETYRTCGRARLPLSAGWTQAWSAPECQLLRGRPKSQSRVFQQALARAVLPAIHSARTNMNHCSTANYSYRVNCGECCSNYGKAHTHGCSIGWHTYRHSREVGRTIVPPPVEGSS